MGLYGASDGDLSSMRSVKANAVLDGASHAVVWVTGRLDASASGASSLTYRGDPDLGSIETSGSSSIHPE